MTGPSSNGTGKFWGAVLIALLVPTILGLIGYGALKSDVRHVQEALPQKASRELVEAHMSAILQQLSDIRSDLRDLKRTKP